MTCAGLVLCGGGSRRMGIAKATLPFGDELLLQRVVRLLGSVTSPLVVVAAAEQPLPPLPAAICIVHDAFPDCGPLEGLRAGLAALAGRVEAAYVTGCDVPWLVPEFVQRLERRRGGRQVVVPVDPRFSYPLAAVYRVDLLPLVERLLAAGRRRLRDVLESADTLRVPADEFREVDPELRTLANLNTPDDYRAALRAAGFPLDRRLARILDTTRQGDR